MADYKSIYYQLVGKITDAIELLEIATQDTEEQFISSKEIKIEKLEKNENEIQN